MRLAFARLAVALTLNAAALKSGHEAGEISRSFSRTLPAPTKYLYTAPDDNKIYFCVPDSSTGKCPSESVLTSQIMKPWSIVPRSSGGYVVAARDRHAIYTLSDAGAVTLVAGEDGTSGTSLSGNCRLQSPMWAEYWPDGSLIIADTGNQRILKKASGSGVCTVLFGQQTGAGDKVIGLTQPVSVRGDGNAGYVIADQGSPTVASRMIYCPSADACQVDVNLDDQATSNDLPTGATYTNTRTRGAVYDAGAGAFKVLVVCKRDGADASEIWTCQSGTNCVVAVSNLGDAQSLHRSQGHYYVSVRPSNNLQVCTDGDAGANCTLIFPSSRYTQVLLPVFPTTTQAYYTERSLVAVQGTELEKITSPNLQSCKTQCDATSGCNSFSYSDQLQDCSLKDKVVSMSDANDPSPPNDYKTYFKACDQFRTSATCPCTWNAYTLSCEASIYMERSLVAEHGRELQKIANQSLESCKSQCDATSSCNSISYSVQLQDCNLQDKLVSMSQPAHSAPPNDYKTYFKACSSFSTAASCPSSCTWNGGTSACEETYILKWVAYEDGDFNQTGEIQYIGKTGAEFYVGNFRTTGCVDPSGAGPGPAKEADHCVNHFPPHTPSALVVRRTDTFAKEIVGVLNCCNNQGRLTDISGSGTNKSFTDN